MSLGGAARQRRHVDSGQPIVTARNTAPPDVTDSRGRRWPSHSLLKATKAEEGGAGRGGAGRGGGVRQTGGNCIDQSKKGWLCRSTLAAARAAGGSWY